MMAAWPKLGSRVLAPEECWEVLRQVGWGVLATVAEGQPYAVPVRYGIDGHDLFFISGPGRKLANLERTPELCLTVVRVRSLHDWRSVVVTGAAAWVPDLRGQLRAVRALRGIQPPGLALPPGDIQRALGGRAARIDVREMTGRAQG